MWVIRRLKKLGADNEDLLEVYFKQIRSILEYAVPVWHSSLVGADISKLERIQKTVLHIVLGDTYKSYRQALRGGENFAPLLLPKQRNMQNFLSGLKLT